MTLTSGSAKHPRTDITDENLSQCIFAALHASISKVNDASFDQTLTDEDDGPTVRAKNMHELLESGTARRLSESVQFAMEGLQTVLNKPKPSFERRLAEVAKLIIINTYHTSSSMSIKSQDLILLRATGILQSLVAMINACVDEHNQRALESVALSALFLHCQSLRRIDAYIEEPILSKVSNRWLSSNNDSIANTGYSKVDAILSSNGHLPSRHKLIIWILSRTCQHVNVQLSNTAIQAIVDHCCCPPSSSFTESNDITDHVSILTQLTHQSQFSLSESALISALSTHLSNDNVVTLLLALSGPDLGARLCSENALLIDRLSFLIQSTPLNTSKSQLLCTLAVNLCDRCCATRRLFEQSFSALLLDQSLSVIQLSLLGIIYSDSPRIGNLDAALKRAIHASLLHLQTNIVTDRCAQILLNQFTQIYDNT